MKLNTFSFLLLFTAYNTFCFGQYKIKKDTLLQVIFCGADGADMEHPRKIANLKFGFKNVYVDSLCCPGCKEHIMGSSNLVQVYNDSIFKIIAKKYGPNWKVNYGNELNKLAEIQKNIEKLLISLKSIPRLPKTFSEDLENRKFLIWVDETKDKNKFNVSVLSWLKKVQPHWNIIYKLLVDADKNEVKVISKKITPI
jgi:hypothetical protein